MKTFAAIVFVSATLLCSSEALAADRVQAGEWETTMTGIGPSPMVTKYCISAKEAKAMSGDLATLRKFVTESTAEKTGGRCSVKNVELKGNRTVVTLVCGKAENVSTTTYHGDRYESASSNGTKVTGKRLGACP